MHRKFAEFVNRQLAILGRLLVNGGLGGRFSSRVVNVKLSKDGHLQQQ